MTDILAGLPITNIWFIVGMVLLAAWIVPKYVDAIFGLSSKYQAQGDHPAPGIVKRLGMATFSLFVTKEREVPDDVTEFKLSKLAGARFWNEVDYTEGRFIYFFRKPSDQGDERKHGYWRIRYRVNVKYNALFGLIPILSSDQKDTPCIFRPGIDTIHLMPGEARGVPPEGLILVKRSMDGEDLAKDPERLRLKVFDMEHRLNVMADRQATMMDMERLEAGKDMELKYHTRLVDLLKRRAKEARSGGAPQGGGEGGFGNPYAGEVYGEGEENAGSEQPPGQGTWEFS